MNAQSRRARTPLRDLLLYHMDSKQCDELEQLDETACSYGAADSLAPLFGSLRTAGVPEHAIHILRLVPIIHTVWADAPPQAEQQQAVLTAAQHEGVRPGMIVFKLLEIWLNARPDPSMFSLWEDYVGALHWAITEDAFEQLRTESVARAQATADAMETCLGPLTPAGGRQAAVDRIAAAFEFGKSN